MTQWFFETQKLNRLLSFVFCHQRSNSKFRSLSQETSCLFSQFLSSMVKKTVLYAGLGVGYFLYRRTLKETIVATENIILPESSLRKLEEHRVVDTERGPLSLHPVSTTKKPIAKETVIVLGAGVIGISTAYLMAQNPRYHVVLVEKSKFVATETSHQNGCLVCPALSCPWITPSFFLHAFNALTDSSYPTSIYMSILGEKFLGTWILNSVLKCSNYLESWKLIHQLGLSSLDELNRLIKEQKIDPKELSMSAKGTLQLVDEFPEDYIKEMNEVGVQYERLSPEELESVPMVPKNRNLKGLLYKSDTNIDTKLFCVKMLENFNKMDNTSLLLHHDFSKFLIEEGTANVRGIISHSRAILSDHVVICCGNESKDVMHKLGVRLPIIRARGYTFDIPKRKENQDLLYALGDDKSKFYVTSLNNSYRVSGMADFAGKSLTVPEERKKLLMRKVSAFSKELDVERAQVWTGFRPLSSDDVPIIGSVPGYQGVYLNVGHGSKGTTLALGSARLLQSIIEGEKTNGVLNPKDFSLSRFISV